MLMANDWLRPLDFRPIGVSSGVHAEISSSPLLTAAPVGSCTSIRLQSLWSLTSAVGLLPPISCYTLRKMVLFSSIMQSVSMPVQLWQARAELRTIVGYAAPMVMLGCVCSFVGAWLLLSGDPMGVRVVAGILFLMFSVAQLTSKARKALKKRLKAQSSPPSSAPALVSVVAVAGDVSHHHPANSTSTSSGSGKHDEDERMEKNLLGGTAASASVDSGSISSEGNGDVAPTVAKQVPTATAAAAVHSLADNTDTDHPSTTSATGDDGAVSVVAAESTCFGLFPLPPSWFPKLSPKMQPRSMLCLLVPAAMGGGLLGGMTGAGGPPLMAAYSMLSLDKDVLRGFGIVPSAFMVVRLSMYTGSDGSVFNPRPESDGGELGVYCGIILASLAGVQFGSHFRSKFDSEALIVAVLLLVFVGSGLMLRLFVNATTTAVYSIIAVTWSAVAGTLWMRPQLLPALEAGLGAVRKRMTWSSPAS